MKRRTTYHLLLTLGACMMLPAGTTVLADEASAEADTSKWICKLCPVSSGWFGDWELGLLYADDPTPRFADYRGLDDDGFYLDVSGQSRYLDEKGYFFDFYGSNLGLDSRSLEMRGGKQGKYTIRANYSEIPRYLGNGTVTPYSGVGTDTLTLADNWQSSAMTPALLESKRKTYGAGITYKFSSAWRFKADFERQNRDGTRAFGGGLFAISGAAFPAPIDYTTDIFTTGLEFTGRVAQLRLGFMSSDFNNGYDSVTWDNPFALGFGDERSRSALEPDNKFHQFSLAGAIRFGQRFRLSGKAVIGEAEQNAVFLPYSINPAYADLDLPRSSLNGKLETSMLNLSGRFYVMLADRLDLTAQYKMNERDNTTPVDVYTPVTLEVFPATPRSNRPYGYDREQLRVDLRWRPTHRIRVNGGARRDTQERSYQETLETEEDTYYGEVQFSAWSWLDTRLKYESGKRDSGEHVQQGNYDRAENPLMRKFNMADRDRSRATIEFSVLPTERIDFTLSYYVTEDEYRNSVVGLQDSEESNINLDFNFAVNKNMNLYAFVSQENIDARMSAADGVGATPWNALTEDEITTWGLGISGRFNDKMSYGLDYISSESEGNILMIDGGTEAPFPVLSTDLTNLRIYLDYRLNDRWGLGFDAYREEYDTSDWYIDGVGPLDIDGIMTMGDISPDYGVNVFRLFATLKF